MRCGTIAGYAKHQRLDDVGRWNAGLIPRCEPCITAAREHKKNYIDNDEPDWVKSHRLRFAKATGRALQELRRRYPEEFKTVRDKIYADIMREEARGRQNSASRD